MAEYMTQIDDDNPCSSAISSDPVRPQGYPPSLSDPAPDPSQVYLQLRSSSHTENQPKRPSITRVTSTIYHIKRTYSHPTIHLRPGIYEFDIFDSYTDYTAAVNISYTLPLLSTPSHISTSTASSTSPFPSTSISTSRLRPTSPTNPSEQDLTILHQRDFALEDWAFSPDILVYAFDAETSNIWTIELEREGGKEGTLGDEHGRVYWPLYFVVKADIWRPSASANQGDDTAEDVWRYKSQIQSSWMTVSSAKVAARDVFKRNGEEWLEYEEFEQGRRVCEWGSNVVVAAVNIGGKRVFLALLKSWREDEAG